MAKTNEILIYTTFMCPYCARAKALLEKKGQSFTEVDVTYDAAEREAMTQKAGGQRTVPQIWINGTHVGGCDDLYALDRAGKLDPMLTAA
ncbi:glutaredoxin 3 [Ferrovibrio sp.]|uniref:glutaredoxin 3 n=1 Tax=Ferrovibrio sp. TaxID=1917215 RepID=UPI00311FEB74